VFVNRINICPSYVTKAHTHVVLHPDETGHVTDDYTVQNHNYKRVNDRETKLSRVQVIFDDVICFHPCCERQA